MKAMLFCDAANHHSLEARSEATLSSLFNILLDFFRQFKHTLHAFELKALSPTSNLAAATVIGCVRCADFQRNF